MSFSATRRNSEVAVALSLRLTLPLVAGRVLWQRGRQRRLDRELARTLNRYYWPRWRRLVRQGAWQNMLSADRDGTTPLQVDRPRGDLGHSALMMAAHPGRRELLERLLVTGAGVYVRDDTGGIALPEPCGAGESVRRLLPNVLGVGAHGANEAP